MTDQPHAARLADALAEAEPIKTSRAIEICLSRLKMDYQTARILKMHLISERDREATDAMGAGPEGGK